MLPSKNIKSFIKNDLPFVELFEEYFLILKKLLKFNSESIPWAFLSGESLNKCFDLIARYVSLYIVHIFLI